MLRRVHVRQLHVGRLDLGPEESHHVKNVLRLTAGDEVEAFDDGGGVATARIADTKLMVVLDITEVRRQESVMQLTIATAVPKGERADWMIEKLSELGCARFIPLAAARSVVLPEGRNKRERWMRIATESAKQSRRAGVMQIDELTRLEELPVTREPVYMLSTEADAKPIMDVPSACAVTLLIGPEGGWSDEELDLFNQRGHAALKLTDTVLRVETAAIAAAAVIMTLAASKRST